MDGDEITKGILKKSWAVDRENDFSGNRSTVEGM